MEWFGLWLMLAALAGAAAWGGYVLWRRGKLTRLAFLPKPPTDKGSP